MRAVIQRINGAEITINGGETRKVGEGLVVFICAMEGDTDAQADFLVQQDVRRYATRMNNYAEQNERAKAPSK